MKQFIIYYKSGTGTYVITEPRAWARENPNHFPNHDVNTLVPNQIKAYLQNEHEFITEEYPENNVAVTFNLNPNINL